jgi:protein arginine N-methyltransferase 1
MIADAVRMDAYQRALQQSIKPGAVVADIGTGVGIFALLACRFGARRVYAIEPADVIQVAREIAAASGCADRVEFIQAMSSEVSLPERADVIVSDLAGALPWHERHIPSIVDARQRLLAPGGILIPRADVAWAAVVEVSSFYSRWMGPWDGERFGLDMTPARRLSENTTVRIRATLDDLLTPVQRWGAIDYTRVDDPSVRTCLRWRTARAGVGHGMVVGFERTFGEGTSFSNSPDAPDARRATIYPQMFFPWPEPVSLETDDEVIVELDGRFVGGEYLWIWKTELAPRGRAPMRFSQSTFFGAPLSPQSLRARATVAAGE